MGWTAVTNDFQWQAAAIVNEYEGALDERKRAVNDGTRTNSAAGTDIQAASFWSTIQAWLETNCVSFANSHDYAGGFHGETTITMYTLATWKVATGLTSGFRRATFMPDDWTDYADEAYSYGQMQAGDIIGPWIFADLQAAFNKLIWTVIGGDFWTATSEYFNGDGGSQATWAAAKTAAEADWQDRGTTGNNPRAFSWKIDYGSPPYGAYLERIQGHQYIAVPADAATINRDYHWYVYVVDAYDEWATHGDVDEAGDPLSADVYNLWDVETAQNGSGTIFSTNLFGSVAASTMPDWAAAGPPPSEKKGWRAAAASPSATAAKCLLRWNVASGFVYVP